MLLLASSCVFYMAFIPVYIFILAITILIDYFAGILIERAQGKWRKAYLVASIVSTCLVLFIFKYFNFFNANIVAIAQFLQWNYAIESLKLILPIGLSFHTFQSLSYVVEVYRGKQKAEYHFGIYALYVMFYPQLVAGPIERPQNLLHQFYEKHDFDYRRVTDGLKLMAWGFFKKLVIADRLAIAVNNVYNNPTEFHGITLLVATFFFSFQIYCDFSGYTDIAIGSAQVMGFKLMDNFNRPYFSKSVSEFWKRWHISLSTWFRDYLYIPIGGNRVSVPRWYFNLFVTFLISGLWHGANWTFVIWGMLHGSYLIFSNVTKDYRSRFVSVVRFNRFPLVRRYLQISTTFALVSFAWIFFRANNYSDACYIIGHIFYGLTDVFNYIDLKAGLSELGLGQKGLIIAFASIAFMELVHFTQRHRHIRQMFAERPLWFRWAMYYSFAISILFFGVFNKSRFIYFQF